MKALGAFAAWAVRLRHLSSINHTVAADRENYDRPLIRLSRLTFCGMLMNSQFPGEATMLRAALAITFLILCSGFGTRYSARDVKGNQVTVSTELRKAVFRRAVDLWQDGRAELIDSVVTHDYVGHTSQGDRSIDGLRARVTEFHALYPNIKFTIEDQLAEGDRIATRMTASGTSKHTGQTVHLVGLNISRFVGNRIAEEWPVWETVR